jgi:hypothetical protein
MPGGQGHEAVAAAGSSLGRRERDPEGESPQAADREPQPPAVRLAAHSRRPTTQPNRGERIR